MPVPWALRGLRDGVVTTAWPKRPDSYQTDFPGGLDLTDLGRSVPPDRDASELAAVCPTGALDASEGALRLDRGRCILCGRCVAAAPDLVAWRPGADTAELSRERLIVPGQVEDEAGLSKVRRQLARRVRRLQRSIHIRHVDAGSDGSDEWEVQALLNPVYDIHRLGIFITASPRHADILLVTGISTPGMFAPLLRTRAAMPDPVVTIATGTDAISGGLFAHGYSSGGGIGSLLDIDVWVPGSPASPFSLLHGILLALGRVPTGAPPIRRRS